MTRFFTDVGMVAIAFFVIYGFMKIIEYNYYSKAGFCENEKVYAAADKFVHGASTDEIKKILTSCLDIDKEDADKILSQSIPHSIDRDSGYSVFIRSVNKALGADVYSEDHGQERYQALARHRH